MVITYGVNEFSMKKITFFYNFGQTEIVAIGVSLDIRVEYKWDELGYNFIGEMFEKILLLIFFLLNNL